jgi:hypothetical protein
MDIQHRHVNEVDAARQRVIELLMRVRGTVVLAVRFR